MFSISKVAALSLAFAWMLMGGEPGVKTEFVGGTLAGVTARTRMHVDLTGKDSLHLHCGKTDLDIPYQKVNTVEYGQRVSRRYAEAVLISPVLLLAKSRKHFVTIGFVDAEGKQQALVIRVEKGDIRSVLTGLEARTGRRVEYQDGEARKAGKG